MHRPEILAPCGSPQSLDAALRAGCDAVYLGGERFSARQNAANFSRGQLADAVRKCHIRGVKVYQAINTIITDDQLDDCAADIAFACSIGIDGLIIQDLALVEIVRRCCPTMPLHASTQMTIHTALGSEFASKLGFSRIVAARELPLENIRRLCSLNAEVEIFVHGALCMSVSGQCYMSAVIGSRSANRGMCAQACRLPADASLTSHGQSGRGADRYDLSLKDLSHVEHLRQLENIGVDSFKIEGRMKRPEYVAAAVDAVRRSMNGQPYDRDLLRKVFSRGGFTDGYLTSQRGREMFGSRQKEDVLSSAEALAPLKELYRREYKRSRIDMTFTVKKDSETVLSAQDENGLTAVVRGNIPQPAANKAANEENLKKQLSKLGDTIYEPKNISCKPDGGLFLPSSEINALRREMCAVLDEKRCNFYTKKIPFTENMPRYENAPPKTLAAYIRICAGARLIEKLGCDKFSLAACPLWETESLLDKDIPTDKLAAQMPAFTLDEERDERQLEKLKNKGLEHIVCTNYSHILMGRKLGLTLHGGHGLNVANSAAMKILKEQGLADCTVSFELKTPQINALRGDMPRGIIAYGRLPLMITANCPVRAAAGCAKCGGRGYIKDRTGRKFPVRCGENKEYSCIFNSVPLYLADTADSFKQLSFIWLNFVDEDLQTAQDIIRRYKSGENFSGEYTRGLYFRGVI